MNAKFNFSPALFGKVPLRTSRRDRERFPTKYPLAHLLRSQSVGVIADEDALGFQLGVRRDFVKEEIKCLYITSIINLVIRPIKFTLIFAIAAYIVLALLGVFFIHTDKLFDSNLSERIFESRTLAYGYVIVTSIVYLCLLYFTSQVTISDFREQKERINGSASWVCHSYINYKWEYRIPDTVQSLARKLIDQNSSIEISVYHLGDNRLLMATLDKESYWIAHW